MVKPWKVAQMDSPTMTVGEKTGVLLEAPEAPMFLQEKTALEHVS
jgi:hypothetical protein